MKPYLSTGLRVTTRFAWLPTRMSDQSWLWLQRFQEEAFSGTLCRSLIHSSSFSTHSYVISRRRFPPAHQSSPDRLTSLMQRTASGKALLGGLTIIMIFFPVFFSVWPAAMAAKTCIGIFVGVMIAYFQCRRVENRMIQDCLKEMWLEKNRDIAEREKARNLERQAAELKPALEILDKELKDYAAKEIL